ncbi:unnamed protein product [Pylaiella littoralis]
MLEAGVELCGAQAALYLRVDLTCPIYWVRWENRKSKANLDIVSDIPRRGTRSVVLQDVVCKADGKRGVKIRYARNRPSETTTSSSLVSLLVNTACARIVGPDSFSPRGGGGRGRGGRDLKMSRILLVAALEEAGSPVILLMRRWRGAAMLLCFVWRS